MARKKVAAERAKKPAVLIRNVVPDRLDLRDRVYMPPVAVVPGVMRAPKTNIPVLDQGQTNAPFRDRPLTRVVSNPTRHDLDEVGGGPPFEVEVNFPSEKGDC